MLITKASSLLFLLIDNSLLTLGLGKVSPIVNSM